jgi:FKBP-type peptidyl-prolyl cis-trans isomerase SlyD
LHHPIHLIILVNIMVVTQDKYITIEYTFSAPDGTLLGSSEYSGPFTFRQGYGDVVPGLDERVEGASVGQELDFIIEPEQGYGVRDDSLVKRFPKESLPLGREPEPGLRVNLGGTIMIITDVTDSEIVLDGNHPLAGIPLHFEVRIADISDQAPESAGGCGCGGTCSC